MPAPTTTQPATPATPPALKPQVPAAPRVASQPGVRWPFLALGAGTLVLAIWKFSTLKKGANVILATVKDAAFTAIIPASARPFANIIQSEAARINVSPFVLVSIGIRESQWGDALRPRGPGGTGDFAARHYSSSRVAALGNTIKLVTVLPSGWSTGGLTGPWYIPADGQGWGRGLMQIDVAAHQDWLRTHDWRDPAQNIRYAADVLASNIAYFSRASTAQNDPRPLTGTTLLHASLAGYNRGPGNVLADMEKGLDIDANTTGRNYGGAVLNAALALQAMLS